MKEKNNNSWDIIQKKKTGFYYLIEFQADGQMINDLEVEIKRDERVIRWQTVKLEKRRMFWNVRATPLFNRR